MKLWRDFEYFALKGRSARFMSEIGEGYDIYGGENEGETLFFLKE